MKINFSSISRFQQLVELKDYRPATKKEYVRYVRKLAEHFQCDPASLSENQIREYFLFLRPAARPNTLNAPGGGATMAVRDQERRKP